MAELSLGIGGHLRSIPRLWASMARLEWKLVTRSPKIFLGWIAADLIYQIASIGGLLLLAQRFAGIGTWNRYQVMFLLGYVAMLDGCVGAFFSNNMAFVSRVIGRGQLEHRLVQPRPLWLSMLTEGFSPCWAGSQFAPGFALFAVALPHLSVGLGVRWWARLAVSMLCSVVVQMSFQVAWSTAAFWSPVGAEEISSETNRVLSNLRPFPLDGFSRALTGTLVTVLPTGLMAWYPARALAGVGPISWPRLLLGVAAAFAVALGLFRLGLRRMFGAGIGRYSDFGHRR